MADSASKTGDVFNIDRINQLIELMKEHDLSEVDLRQDKQQIRLCRGATSLAVPAPQPLPAPVAAAPAAPAAAEEDPNIVTIVSPMVGTFYARANPKADPYVKVGDRVTAETTVCIVEAMKVFNEIPAEVNGEIVAILADDQEPVDHGRPLFKVDTSR